MHIYILLKDAFLDSTFLFFFFLSLGMELSGRACAQTASAGHSRLQKPTNITDIVQDTLMLQFGVGMSSKGPGIENMAPSLGPDGEGVEKFKKWTLDEMAVSFYFFLSWRL